MLTDWVRSIALLASVLVIQVSSPLAQTAGGYRDIEPREYEVASVKPADNGIGGLPNILASNAGQFHITNATVASLVQLVFSVGQSLILSAPDWTRTDKWEVQLVAAGWTVRDQPGQVLKMLQDRFQLRTHVETRELPIYELERVRLDRFGDGVTPVGDSDCKRSQTGVRERWSAKCTPWGVIVAMVSQNLDRPALDKTGISGSFDVDFEWQPNAQNAVSIFTALREQLGIKAEGRRGPVKVVVVDHIERPVEN
jgi:uncharacterized protein (TIGR03435 family)